jgi:hypothetical protein
VEKAFQMLLPCCGDQVSRKLALLSFKVTVVLLKILVIFKYNKK